MHRWKAAVACAAVLAGCTTGGLPSTEPLVGTHALSRGQIQAIVTAAGVDQEFTNQYSAGPMKAVVVGDGSVEFCAIVYTGGTSLLGSPKQIFLVGTFPAPSSEAVEVTRPISEVQAYTFNLQCNSKGIGVN